MGKIIPFPSFPTTASTCWCCFLYFSIIASLLLLLSSLILFLTLLSCSLHTCRLMNNWFLFIAYVLIFQLYTMSDCLLLFISLVCTLSPKIVVLSICCNAIFLLVIGTHVLIVVMCLVWSLLLLSQMRVLFLASFFVLISDDWSLSLPFNKEWFCSSHFLSVLVFPLIHDVFMLTWHDIVFQNFHYWKQHTPNYFDGLNPALKIK